MNNKAFQLTLPKFTERLKIMNSNIMELLRKETTRLLTLQSETLTEALAINNFLSHNESQEQKAIGIEEVKSWISHLENEQQKLNKLEMVLAVIGTMKAGKSTTINAIVGMEILPNRETAMTTLPTLIRNKHGQPQPILTLNKVAPLLTLSKQVAAKLQTFDKTAIEQIDLQGIEDGKTLIATLIASGGYQFAKAYQGQEAIFEFLKHLNDVMRLAKDKAIDIEPPYHEYENLDDLPVIEVEFCHLKDNKDTANGSLAILDTPGPNEFGQSDALRRVFKMQLEKASAILLVTDFTQMKTEADEKVRAELDKIKDFLSEDRLAVIVNKYDQANKNSMSKEEVQKYVAGTLMQGKVETSKVFPVSSYFAYLANRAKSHLQHNEKLPDPKQEPWVADFGDKAFGRRWEHKIDDIDEVNSCIDDLWNDSYFEAPIESVIKEAHATAALKSLETALQRLSYYNNEIVNTLNLRSSSMSKSINDIEQMKQNLQNDIDDCKSVESHVYQLTDKFLSQLTNEIDSIMDAQQTTITQTIDKFFQAGKRVEKSQTDQMLKAELQNSAKNHRVPPIIPSTIWDSLFPRTPPEKDNAQRFDPKSPKITFRHSHEADKLTKNITKDVESIFKDADEQLTVMTNKLLEKTTEEISQAVDDTIEKILEKAQKKLQNQGIALNFQLPKIDLKSAAVDASELFNAGYEEKTETRTASRRKSSSWGRFCNWLNDDWGWEDYTKQETLYIVDITKIQSQVTKQLHKQKSTISDQTKQYLSKSFQPEIDKHLENLVNYLERYRGELDKAIQSSSLDHASKSELIEKLKELLESQMLIKNDLEEHNKAIKAL
ncbi:dynamin family protein [Methylovulum psychrotolerans]|uniref:dynamin family protein n=1 Tax=Methylovulum psychrotolerans TaxID=1704499 RepID=UPI001BFFB6E1|nr:dynamin family protein [Methylovulum psychrotolerans]MBT9096794.1 dynamin family protein [Methylovulum psychrotolerans]